MNEPNADELLPTRQSLLSRLKDWQDQESWRVFFDTYWRFIYSAALKAGLTEAEAQDVVQETLISVSKHMVSFKYDANGSFKSWLLRLTSWRVMDQFRKRPPGLGNPPSQPNTATGTATIERVADPTHPALEALWDEEWERNLMQVALERVKKKVSAKQYQIFSFYVLRRWPVSRVTRALNVSTTMVYLSRHRVGRLLKKELAQLQAHPLPTAAS
jgi:RNA polymerase sigma factor (sigma-70 family)